LADDLKRSSAMTRAYRKGAKVSWAWGANRAEGQVAEVFTRRVQRTLKGAKVVRNGSEDEPAYLVTQEDGAKALKSHSELDPR
jgi:hypothetical protein